MKLVGGLFFLSAAVIVTFWWWLGLPVPVTVNALASGEKIECLSYSPFRDGQTPIELSTRIEPWQIEEDLRGLAPLTNCIRTYSVHQGLDQVLPIAKRFGLRVLLGIWLGRDPEFNRNQIATAVALVNQYPEVVEAVVVGNEVLLRGEMSANGLADTIREVKRQVPVPVTYADVWEFWLRNRDLLNAVDFVTIHILPYWEDDPIDATRAADHVASIRRQVAESFPGKDILIGEVGWPSAGRMREGALPSPSNQARVLREVIAKSKSEKFRINLIEAFDQPWKRRFEGTVGGYWGLLDGATREPKFAWERPVSDHPHWRWFAAAGVVLSAFVFGAAFISRNQNLEDPSSFKIWAGVALSGTCAGGLLGLTIEQGITESFELGGLIRAVALTGLAIIVPLVGAAALRGNAAMPSFAETLDRKSDRPRNRLGLVAGLAFAAIVVTTIYAALGLVFDPRYRDFPDAALTAMIVPFALLFVMQSRRSGSRPLAELLAAITLTASAIYIAFNESLANWQALWFAAVLLLLSFTLARVRDGQNSAQ
ncbi:MAG: glycoside hydrolase family 17 protein [Xanthobacteraceae bacterium]